MTKSDIKLNSYFYFFTFLLILFLSNKSLFAMDEKRFKQVEAIGRAVLIVDDIQTSRKRALEDALYLAALKGGADINGFSAITSNTVINDQSVVTATNRVIDFKIIKEEQDKEFLSIKISAVVGNKMSNKNCKVRPINIALLRGYFNSETNIPSKLSRQMSRWYNNIYDIISQLPNVKSINYRNKSLDQIIKSNINPTFDYNALTNGLPSIQAGNYSVVPELSLITNNQGNTHSNYLLKVSIKIYKGNNFELMTVKTYDLPIQYERKSNFQFIRSISTLNIDLIDKTVFQHLNALAHNILKELNCSPLEGKLTFTKGELRVDIGKNQGIRDKQIGIVKGLNIKNSMLYNSSVILHTNKIFDNYSIVSPLNDKIKLNNLNNLMVEFAE
jgi:hypothetical protein